MRMAATGEALRGARTHLPDLILMNLSIPVVDGWECSRQLKAPKKIVEEVKSRLKRP